jgi:uncharacterized protein (DUF2126 family)
MAQVFQQGLNVPRGFVLPVQRWNAKAASRWRAVKMESATRKPVSDAW